MDKTTAKRAAKRAVEFAKRPWGNAWNHITHDHRRALVCRELISNQRMQDDSITDGITLTDMNMISEEAMELMNIEEGI